MNTKDLEIKYTPTFSNKPHVPEYDLIETFFERVDYTEKAVGIYEFDFYDKEGEVHQLTLDLKLKMSILIIENGARDSLFTLS